MDNSWYKKIILSRKKEIVSSAIFFTLFILAILIWRFLAGKQFQWQDIEIVSEPSIFDLPFYKAFAYLTVGAFLYYVVKLWKILYIVCVELLGNRKLYNNLKGVIRILILLITYYITPKIFDLINYIFSLIYNILNLLLYLIPPFGIASIIFIMILLYNKNTSLNDAKIEKVNQE